MMTSSSTLIPAFLDHDPGPPPEPSFGYDIDSNIHLIQAHASHLKVPAPPGPAPPCPRLPDSKWGALSVSDRRVWSSAFVRWQGHHPGVPQASGSISCATWKCPPTAPWDHLPVNSHAGSRPPPKPPRNQTKLSLPTLRRKIQHA